MFYGNINKCNNNSDFHYDGIPLFCFFPSGLFKEANIKFFERMVRAPGRFPGGAGSSPATFKLLYIF